MIIRLDISRLQPQNINDHSSNTDDTTITKTIDDKSVEEIENMFKPLDDDQKSTVIDLHLNDPARIFEHDDCKGHSVTLPVPWTLAENTGGWTLRSTLEAWNYDDL